MRYASKHGAGLTFRTINLKQIEEIHSTSLRILSEVGVLVHHEEALALLAGAGAHQEGENRVYLPAFLVERALRSAPTSITLYNRLGKPALLLERSNVYFGAGSDTLIYLDPFTGERRPWLSEDVAGAIRLVDALPHRYFVKSMGLLSDVDRRMINRRQYALMLQNSIKPQVVIAEDAATVADIVEMAAAVMGGKEVLQHRPHFALYCEPTSPLQLPLESVDKLLLAAEHRVPVNFACGAVAGASTPVTVAGTVAQANAEALSGLVIHQLKNPGAPFLYGYGDSPLDMRSMQALYAVPEALLLQGALCDLARFYGLPSWGYAGCSSAKLFDEQAVTEATIFTLLGALQGCNLMHDVFYIESGRTGSLELLTLMDEVISRVKFFLRGLDTSAEHLGLEAIRRVGPAGSFLGDQHTASHFRNSWQPSLSDFSSFSEWEAAGSRSTGERIKEKIERLLKEHRPTPLDPAVEKEIEKIIERAQQELPPKTAP